MSTPTFSAIRMATTRPGEGGPISLEPTFSSRLRFTCTRCGACCRHVGAGVGLTDDDLTRLGKTARVKPEHPIFTDILESEAGVCSHLSENDCSVYRERPLMCRLYPFYVGVKADGTLQLSVDHCPGVDLPEADLVDDGYVQREILPSLVQDPDYLASLRKCVESS
jgi:Fe-S-cluster containining protein